MRSTISLRLIIGGALLCLTLPVAAHAQLSPGDISAANQQGSRIQREEQLRQRDDAQRSLQNDRQTTYIEAPEVATPKGKGAGCRRIKEINITGAARMPEMEKARISSKYAPNCVGVTEIQALLGEITTFYIDNGYATTRAYLPGQDLSTGLLQVQVVEGNLKNVQLDEKSGGTIFVPGAFPYVNDRVLNLRDIEQGLDQVNRLSSNNASIDIVPGAKVGESTILVKNNPGKRWHSSVTADSYGTKSTGRYQGSANVSLDDLLGLNEFYSYTRRQTIPTDGDNRNNESNSVLFSVPYGYTTLLVGYSDSNYESNLVTPSALSVKLSGITRSTYVTVDETVYRDKFTKGSLSATLTNKNTKNYVQNTLLAVSSHELTILDLGGNISTKVNNTSLTFGATFSQGLNFLNGEEDVSGLPGSAPRAQFRKFGINASQFTPFQFEGHDFLFSSVIAGQFALDALLGSEQFSVGGVYTVRGFYEDTLANDNGYYLRNDISMPQTVSVMGHEFSAKPYVALDTGYVTGHASGTPSGNLVGTALGLTLARGPISFDIYSGVPLFAPDRMDNDGLNTFARLSVSF